MLKQVVKEGNYFNSLEEKVNEDIQKAVQEFRENQGGTNLKAIAEKYNLNEKVFGELALLADPDGLKREKKQNDRKKSICTLCNYGW